MALLFIDGFDHYATADIQKKWSNNDVATMSATLGRRGGGALICNGASQWVQKNFDAYETALIIGMAVRYDMDTSAVSPISLWEGTTSHVTILLHTDGRISVYRGTSAGTLLGQSLPGIIGAAQWFYLEAKVVFGDATGAVEIRVNGSTVIALTNVDTNSGGSLGFSNLRVGYTTGDFRVDDLYICNTAGTVNNDFLGDCRVDAYLPTVDGAVQAWTPTPVGTHYTTVDEAAPNLTDYIASATVGNKDLFGVPDLINTPLSIFGVQLAALAWKTDAGFREIKGLVRISGTDYPSSAIAVTESDAYKLKVWDQNPATSTAWTPTTVNAAEWGVEVA